jgi:hypothetical protein
VELLHHPAQFPRVRELGPGLEEAVWSVKTIGRKCVLMKAAMHDHAIDHLLVRITPQPVGAGDDLHLMSKPPKTPGNLRATDLIPADILRWIEIADDQDPQGISC